MPPLRRTECPLFDIPRNFLRHAKRLDYGEQMALFRRLAEQPKGSPEWVETRNAILPGYYMAAVKVAKKQASFGADPDDMVQAACMGLIRGVELYDPRSNAKPSTYLFSCMISCCRREAEMQRNLVGGVRAAKVRRETGRTEGRFYATFGRWPSIEELSELTGFDIPSIRRAVNADATVSVSRRGKTGRQEWLPDRCRVEDDDTLFTLIRQLRERDRDVINRRFGFDGEDQTLEEVGDALGLSRERVRQIEEKALHFLKRRAVRDRHLMKAFG